MSLPSIPWMAASISSADEKETSARRGAPRTHLRTVTTSPNFAHACADRRSWKGHRLALFDHIGSSYAILGHSRHADRPFAPLLALCRSSVRRLRPKTALAPHHRYRGQDPAHTSKHRDSPKRQAAQGVVVLILGRLSLQLLRGLLLAPWAKGESVSVTQRSPGYAKAEDHLPRPLHPLLHTLSTAFPWH